MPCCIAREEIHVPIGHISGTHQPEYCSPDFDLMRKQMKSPVIVDGRNVYDRDQIESMGFTYYGIGK